MMNSVRMQATAAALGLTLVACGGSARSTATAPGPQVSAGASSSHAVLRAPNAADVSFMQGMIPHHAQAVLIAGWAPSHGARPDVQRLCERIVVAQRDEIALMQNWLRERGQEVPPADATHMRMTMGGMTHDMLMPGMLTDEQLRQLDAARGSEFDRLFLEAMIRHHKGAISMVDELEASNGARQDEVVFRFSSDVYADQTTEVERMEKMLATIR